MKTAARFEDFPPYTPIEPFEVLSARLGRPVDQIIKLDANENPYGASPRVAAALADLAYTHIYPDPEARALRAGLAAFTGVPQENLLAGAGADELIDLLLRVLIEPGDAVLNFPPTFGMYAFDTRLSAGRVIEIPRRPNFSLDLPAVEAAVLSERPKALFVTSPNNPDGSLISPSDLETLLEMPVLVVLDEAYIEFTRQGGRLGSALSRITEVPQRTNLVVLRTFSKWAGLAGLRVGYGAFPNWLLPVMWKAKQPYNINVAASAAALASIEDLEYLAEQVDRLRSERDRLYDALRDCSFLHPYPSEANFVLCRVSGLPAVELRSALMERGIFVRYYNTPLLRDCIRISAGRVIDTDAVLSALSEIAIERSL
jgi:histidinol-phosphate aminotransferase